jgi:hypothetical protein
MKRIAISQSNYIPWKGYFDLINSVDEFVIYDSVQFTKNDWRNRNLLKTIQGLKWLTIPVSTSGKQGRSIAEMEVADLKWQRTHWQSWQTHYARAAHFPALANELQSLYLDHTERKLSRINFRFLSAVCRWLLIKTKLSYSTDYSHTGERSERLLQICRQAGASHYLSGPAARAYLDVELLARNGVQVQWMDYSGYRPYRQLHGAFEHRVSVLDLLLNEGPDARHYLLSCQSST